MSCVNCVLDSIVLKRYYHICYHVTTITTELRFRHRVANITDFSIEVRNLENDPYFSRFLYSFEIFGFFTDFANFWFFSTFFILIGDHHRLWPWSSWTASSDKKYMELNGAALNVNKPCVTSRKTAFWKDK